MPCIDKQKQSNRNEPPTSENGSKTKQHMAKTNTSTKNKTRKFKENYEREKD